jgi:hypothetical protein
MSNRETTSVFVQFDSRSSGYEGPTQRGAFCPEGSPSKDLKSSNMSTILIVSAKRDDPGQLLHTLSNKANSK